MKVFTIQIARWRWARGHGATFVDTTVKSGEAAFAPTWEIVLGLKWQGMSPEVYTEKYHAILDESLVKYPEKWDELLAIDVVALGCYCRNGFFCHRHLLKERVKELCRQRNIPFVDGGEILTKAS